MPYIIYADLESLIKKKDGCANNPEKSSITKTGEDISCEYSMSTVWAFDNIGNKHTLHRVEDSSSLTEYATNVTNFLKRKKVLLLTKKG